MDLDARFTEQLKPRHREVLFLLSKGLRNAEIGRQMGLSTRTVKGYVRDLFFIFEATNRTELVGLIGTERSESAQLAVASLPKPQSPRALP